MLDNTLTEKIQRFLALPQPTDDDVRLAAELVLSVTHDKPLFLRIQQNPRRMASFTTYKLRKILAVRLEGMTMADVARMDAEVLPAVDGEAARRKEAGHTGRRPDHDRLPDEVKALWTDAAALWKKVMRTRALLDRLDAPCDRFEHLKPLKEMWYAYRRLLCQYDDYQPAETSAQ